MSQADDGSSDEETPDLGSDDASGEDFSLSEAKLLEIIEEYLLGSAPKYDRGEVAKRVGVPVGVAQSLWHSLGFAHADEGEVVFTDADVEALTDTMDLIHAGILDADSQAALVRTWGRSFARLAEWQVLLLANVARESPDPDARLDELAENVVPRVERLQTYIWRRHLVSAASRMLLRPSTGESAVQAIGFVDIVGYTTQSKNLSEAELMSLVEHFEDVAAGVVTDHGGQLIKTIGDEVLFTTPDARQGALIALELVERNKEDEDFPKVRAGVAYGDVVNRLGDVFGPTVNVASRLTTVARPGRVLIDAGMHEQLEEDTESFRLRRVRRTSVKGYSRLESWRLSRSKRAAEDEDAGTGESENTSGDTAGDALAEPKSDTDTIELPGAGSHAAGEAPESAEEAIDFLGINHLSDMLRLPLPRLNRAGTATRPGAADEDDEPPEADATTDEEQQE